MTEQARVAAEEWEIAYQAHVAYVEWRRVLDEALNACNEEIERLRAASRTRPTYDLRCPCGAPHWLDTSIPSEIWNQIAEPHELLCPLCIDDRLVKAGLTAEAEFYFVGAALTSKLYQESHGDIQAAVAAEREQWADKVEAWPNGMEYGPGVEDFVRAAVDGAIEAIKDEIAAALRAPGPTP